MFYTIYKITDKINKKIYIGMHKTKDLNDGYMGSGKYLKRAIRKYGIENFKKEILFLFDDEQEMKSKEKELVNEEFLSRDDVYNLCPGGKGGFGYINSNELAINTFLDREKAKSASKKGIVKLKILHDNDKDFKEKHKKVPLKHSLNFGRAKIILSLEKHILKRGKKIIQKE